MSRLNRPLTALLFVAGVAGSFCLEAATVGQWGRHVVSLSNSTYSGNPFELEVDATFTHTSSGTQLTLPGYYAGNDTWKIGFMPTLIGEWTWTTSSTDPDLNGQSGSVDAVASTSLGMLKADTTHPAKWKYTDGDYVVPIGVFVQIMHGAGSTAEFNTFADFLQTNNLQLVNFRLCEQDICFSDVGALEMDLTLWDRLEERLEILSDRNLGVEIMLYTDDGGAPSYGAESATEKFLIRYMVARLAGFPNVLFNSGIDIWEYRGFTTWYDWYGNEVKQHDPYAHPVSSRPQNSEEESRMSESVRTYNGVGHRNSLLADLLLTFGHGEAASELDNWAEDQTGENGHTPADIRRAAWKATIAGGLAFHVRHNETNDCANGIIPNCDNPFTVTGIASQLDSEQWLTLVNPILQSTLGSTFGAMVPEPSLVANGYAISNPARTKILYFLMGVNDTWDLGNGGDLTLKLTGLIGTYDANWLDPRTGALTSIGSFSGGSDYNLTPPSNDDWVLLLQDGAPSTRSLMVTPPPTAGDVTSTPAGINCGADCQEDYQYAAAVGLAATADYGSEFDSWAGDPDCWDGQLVMIVDATCEAVFVPCSVQSIVDLPPQTAGGIQTFEACNELRAGTGGFLVDNTGDVTFKAGNVIKLSTGFSVDSGAIFRAVIDNAGTAGDPPPLPPSGLSATRGDTQVTLDWADSTEPDLAGYWVHRSTVSGGPYSTLPGFLSASAYVDSSVTNGTTYFYVVTAEDTGGNESADSNQASATPGTGLLGHWRFDEGTGSTVGDEVGGTSGTVSGASWVTGISGNALAFNGSSDHVTMANNSVLDIVGTSLTLSAWIYPHDGGGAGGSRVISKRTDATGSDVYAMYTFEDRLRFRLDGQDMISSGTFATNQWLHVAMVYDGVDKRIYLAGGLDPAAPQAKTDSIDASARAVHLGMREGESRHFDGVIDEVRIYDRALTAGEVAALASVPPP